MGKDRVTILHMEKYGVIILHMGKDGVTILQVGNDGVDNSPKIKVTGNIIFIIECISN